MSDSLLSRFMKGIISIGLANVVTMALGLVGMVVAARLLPPADFGGFVLLGVVASFLAQMSSCGLELSVAKFLTGMTDEEDRARTVNTAISFRLFTVVLISLVVLSAQTMLSPALTALFGSSLLPDFVLYIPVLFLLESLKAVLRAVHQGMFRFRTMSISEFIAGVFNFVFILVFLLPLHMGALGLIFARAISMALACVFLYATVPVAKRLQFHLGTFKDLVSFGGPLQINDILTFIFNRVDTLVIGALLGPADVAYYAFARRIPDSLRQLYDAFRSVYFTFMSKLFANGDQAKAAQMLNNSTRLITFTTIFGALIALVFGRDIITLLFSAKYLPSQPSFMLLMVGLSVALIGNILGTSLVAVGDSGKPALINIAHMVVNLVCNFTLIPVLGIAGAAVASLAGSITTNPLNVYFLRRRDVNVHTLEYLKPLLAFGTCALIFLLFSPTGLVLRGGILALYLVLSLLFSVVTRGDLRTILQWFNRARWGALRNVPSRSA